MDTELDFGQVDNVGPEVSKATQILTHRQFLKLVDHKRRLNTRVVAQHWQVVTLPHTTGVGQV